MVDNTITIPPELVEKLEKRAKESEFENLSDYVSYILRQVLSKVEAEKQEIKDTKEEEQVKQKLRDLGYLN